MEVKAKLKTYRQSARKVRLLAREISGKPVDQARADLNVASKRVAPVLLKLLASAEANAKDRKVDSEGLYIKSIWVDEGPTMFRMMPRAHGRAFVIRKRTCHINMVLAPREVSEGTKPEDTVESKEGSATEDSGKKKAPAKGKISNKKAVSAS